MKTHYCNALSNTVYPVGSHLHFLVVELSSVVSSEQGSDRHVDGGENIAHSDLLSKIGLGLGVPAYYTSGKLVYINSYLSHTSVISCIPRIASPSLALLGLTGVTFCSSSPNSFLHLEHTPTD